MMSSSQRLCSFVMVMVMACLCLAGADSAEPTYARQCQHIATKSMLRPGQNTSEPICQQRVCGKMPPSPLNFHERLSPQCSALMDQYRSQWSRDGVSNLLTPAPKCFVQNWVTSPTGPFLVSNQHHPIATFAMCTIPKVACTNFRKLLNTVLRHPEPMPTDAFDQNNGPHRWRYPSVHLYEPPSTNTTRARSQAWGDSGITDEPRLPEGMPSFVVGRNPYVKVLSGFLDKMTYNPKRHDQWTFKHVNQKLGVREDMKWPNTVHGFQAFIKKLSKKGVDEQDGHFRQASTQTVGEFKMDYYLRLEDMPQWFPCWMHGLGLRNFTEYGWASSKHGRIHVGMGDHTTTETEQIPSSWDTIFGGAARPTVSLHPEQRRLWSPWTSHYTGTRRQVQAHPPWSRTPDKAGAVSQGRFSERTDPTLASSLGTEQESVAGFDGDDLGSDGDLDGIDGTLKEDAVGAHAGGRKLLASQVVMKAVRGDLCWWSPEGTSCRDYYDSFTLPDGTVVPGAEPSQDPDESQSQFQETLNDQHDVDAVNGWERYYDQETSDLVYEMYAEDFHAFGYERFVVEDH